MIYYVGLLSFDSDLAHHGIKNQKWGRRRYQNEDGSLTSLGYEHYYGENGISKDAQRRREKKKSNKRAEANISFNNQQTDSSIKSNKKKNKKSKDLVSEYRTKEEKELMNAKNNVGEIMVYGTEDENGKRVKARITVETANGIIESNGKIPISELISKGGLKDNSAYKGVLKAYGNIFVNDLPKDYAESVNKSSSKKKKKNGKYAEATIDFNNQNISSNSKKKSKKKKAKTVKEEITFGGDKIQSISNGHGRINYGY